MRLWAVLLAGPVLFLAGIIGVSVWLGASGVPPERIGAEAAGYAPQLLVGVLLGLAVIAGRLPVADLWAVPSRGRVLTDAGIGAVVGAVLALAYLVALAPLLTQLQALGDYVPPGEVLATVSASIPLFFVANVLLAPMVEETIYRGLGLRELTLRHGRTAAVVLSCVAFGLLHWTGGLWYMVLTGVVAGGSFTALALWRGGLVAPFAAHLTLNMIEFAYAAN
jgi:membrane protease YdiL (CAAX protease family)